MTELASRQNMKDLEEVVRRHAKRAHETVLNRLRHLAEPSLVVLSLKHVKSLRTAFFSLVSKLTR